MSLNEEEYDKDNDLIPEHESFPETNGVLRNILSTHYKTQTIPPQAQFLSSDPLDTTPVAEEPSVDALIAESERIRRKIPTPSRETIAAIRKTILYQLEALRASRYRITAVNTRRVTLIPYLPLTKDELLEYKKIARLYYLNEEGFNIFITCLDDDVHYILLDDVTPRVFKHAQFQFKPCLILRSSPGNFQCIFRVQMTRYDHQACIEVFHELNQRYGDKKIRGLIHPFRLTGFKNIKQKHYNQYTQQYPDVWLYMPKLDGKIPQEDVYCPICTEMVQEALLSPIPKQRNNETQNTKRTKLDKDLDQSVIDFNVVCSLLRMGYDDTYIIHDMLSKSPNITERHGNTLGYIELTLQNAKRIMSNWKRQY